MTEMTTNPGTEKQKPPRGGFDLATEAARGVVRYMPFLPANRNQLRLDMRG